MRTSSKEGRMRAIAREGIIELARQHPALALDLLGHVEAYNQRAVTCEP